MIALKIKLLCKHTDFNCKIKMVGGRSGKGTKKEQSGRGTKGFSVETQCLRLVVEGTGTA